MLPVCHCVTPNALADPPPTSTAPQTAICCRGSLSPCDSMSRTCRAAYPACAQPVSALIIAPEVAFPCALYAAQCGKTVRGLLTHSDDDPVHPEPFSRYGRRPGPCVAADHVLEDVSRADIVLEEREQRVGHAA